MSGASALRNAVKRVTHKERAQPSDRKKYGLLEKHKDYKERSNDYHSKQKYLKNMRGKALNKNPDEFYFAMNNAQVKNGKHRNQPDNAIDAATVALLKTQDMGYISMKKSIDDSKVRKLKENMHMIGERRVKSHKIFLDDNTQLSSFDPTLHFDTPNELIDRAFNRPKISMIGTLASIGENAVSDLTTSLRSSKSSCHLELQQRSTRSSKLKIALLQLSLQRSLTAKGTKRKINSTQKSFSGAENSKSKDISREVPTFKWKRQRSR